nr:immunoglobulin light chain junction region [Macaca mulatta]MOW04169.1 immunoglobulin light chain junction region [Macaca mulatta]MOW05006.1 immunoglobulin light chain junction region [Macaca mulatta]MOW05322.1 immunoglobulin light chain junction region [Macaca mulatta]MOW05391.1 immunoglobulin light chain junction region [Macaca mulatta]
DYYCMIWHNNVWIF